MRSGLDSSSVVVGGLRGKKRVWRYVTGCRFSGDKQKTIARTVFLDVADQSDTDCNGVFLPITDAVLHCLDQREKGYKRLDVTDRAYGVRSSVVYAYQSSPAFRVDNISQTEAVVPRRYLERIEAALSYWGDQFRTDYEASTQTNPFRVRDGDYEFADAQQNSAARRGKENR